MGSTKNVPPLLDTSCTSPGTSFLCSDFTGTTNRPLRWVIIGSCKYFDCPEEMSFCRMSLTFPPVARMLRRMEASSLLALSAISPSAGMEPVIFSSR